ncbi:MAG: hypothetical protein RIR70_1849 [Pseudomonadota bacterium]|jgi:ADP-L-glycero-D-manno-heptose 6-epimerase
MYYIITGAAGFIGSNLVAALNARGINNIIAVDDLTQGDKFKNIAQCEIADYLDKADFLARLEAGDFDGAVEAVLHQGACSDTMEHNGQFMMENNYRYSLSLLDFCSEQDVPLLYASSAAVYGGGKTFQESRSFEAPLNVYGYSKFLFDQVVRKLGQTSSQIAGFRYFNVYGPNEQHKGRMASVAFHHFNQYRDTGRVKLFEGCDGYANGEQKRDFVFIDDVVKVNLFFLDNPQISGIFNLGTGRAQSFNEVALATVNACRAAQGQSALLLPQMVEQGILEYIAFPEALKGKYQSFTQADITKLREAGYTEPFADVATGVACYSQRLLAQASVG